MVHTMHKGKAEGACAAMEEAKQGKLYVSTGRSVEQVSWDAIVLGSAPLDGAGALCAGKEAIFCADASGTIWRLNQKTMMPESVFFGGPGICDLCLSADENKLYALLADADSVVMLDSHSGRPLLLNRCGCNPSGLLSGRDVLAAAGGESGCVHLYDADTLICTKEISMPGPVQAIAFDDRTLYALCLTAQLDTLLVKVSEVERKMLRLDGMPGSLCVHEGWLYAATQGLLYVFDGKTLCLQRRSRVPGRPSRMIAGYNKIIMHDPLSGNLCALHANGRWQILAADVKSFCEGSAGFDSLALDLQIGNAL